MIKVYQTKFHSDTQSGNCVSACIASFLEVQISRVPQFERLKGNDKKIAELRAFMKLYYNFKIVISQFPSEEMKRITVPPYYFVTGQSMTTNETGHMVIHHKGRLFHDPNPEGTGIEDIELYLYPIKM